MHTRRNDPKMGSRKKEYGGEKPERCGRSRRRGMLLLAVEKRQPTIQPVTQSAERGKEQPPFCGGFLLSNVCIKPRSTRHAHTFIKKRACGARRVANTRDVTCDVTYNELFVERNVQLLADFHRT